MDDSVHVFWGKGAMRNFPTTDIEIVLHRRNIDGTMSSDDEEAMREFVLFCWTMEKLVEGTKGARVFEILMGMKSMCCDIYCDIGKYRKGKYHSNKSLHFVIKTTDNKHPPFQKKFEEVCEIQWCNISKMLYIYRTSVKPIAVLRHYDIVINNKNHSTYSEAMNDFKEILHSLLAIWLED